MAQQENKPKVRRSLQTRLAIGYAAIIAALLILLNTYPLITTQNLMFRSQQTALQNQAALVTNSLTTADELTPETVEQTITPLEAGLDFGVKMGKDEFIGKDALVAAGAPKRVRVGLGVTGRGIVREHQDVFIGDEKIGVSTSGTHCPYLGKAIAMALVDANHAEVGTAVEVEVRGRRVACEIIPLPFYTRGK